MYTNRPFGHERAHTNRLMMRTVRMRRNESQMHDGTPVLSVREPPNMAASCVRHFRLAPTRRRVESSEWRVLSACRQFHPRLISLLTRCYVSRWRAEEWHGHGAPPPNRSYHDDISLLVQEAQLSPSLVWFE